MLASSTFGHDFVSVSPRVSPATARRTPLATASASKRDRIHTRPGPRRGHPVHALRGDPEGEPPFVGASLTVNQAVRPPCHVQPTGLVAVHQVWPAPAGLQQSGEQLVGGSPQIRSGSRASMRMLTRTPEPGTSGECATGLVRDEDAAERRRREAGIRRRGGGDVAGLRLDGGLKVGGRRTERSGGGGWKWTVRLIMPSAAAGADPRGYGLWGASRASRVTGATNGPNPTITGRDRTPRPSRGGASSRASPVPAPVAAGPNGRSGSVS
ncbi:hypothetical protein SALBM311S_07160 [Streptomyces alboniger]